MSSLDNLPLSLVVKICCCLVGMVVFLLIREVITPPAVSMPRLRGATSRRRRSETASEVSPTRMAACTGTIGNSLVRVDGLVELLAVEEVLKKLLDLGDPGGASHEDDVVDG